MIVGSVDARGRPLVPLVVYHATAGNQVTLEACVDTGFTDTLILPQKLVANLGLPKAGTIQVILAGGVQTAFDAYQGDIEWFGVRRTLRVMASGDPLPLVGYGLLKGCLLTVDYAQDCVTITAPAPGPVP